MAVLVTGQACHETPQQPSPLAARVAVTSAVDSLIGGDSIQLTASAWDAEGAIIPTATFSWWSGDSTVALVSQLGVVHARRPGAAIIAVQSDSVKNSVQFRVVPIVATVRLVPDTILLVPGGTGSVVARVLDSAGADIAGRVVTWSVAGSGGVTLAPAAAAQRMAVGTSDTGHAIIVVATAGKLDTAVVVVARLQIVSLTVGSVTCGLEAAGRAWCWGAGLTGALGHGDWADAWSPRGAYGGLRFKRLAITPVSYEASTACALTLDGRAYCWGSGHTPAPEPMWPGMTFTDISLGADHACAVATDGAAYCWGGNSLGQTGVGSYSSSVGLVAVVGGHRFTSIAAGTVGTCGLATDSLVYCWGGPDLAGRADSELPSDCGPGYAVVCQLQPRAIAASGHFTRLSVAAWNACARAADSTFVCWGNAFGRAPLTVLNGRRLASLNPGDHHECLVGFDGTAACQGEGGSGQLGNGGMDVTADFVTVGDGHLWNEVFPGGDGTCGLERGGTAYCWGSAIRVGAGVNPGGRAQIVLPLRVLGQP
jgi:hypothetical protein